MYSRNMRMNKNNAERPSPPPNYRGMVYSEEKYGECDVYAEGIDRMVCNDKEYSQKMQGKKGRKCVLGDECGCALADKNGINAVVDGLASKRFDPEDILVCAMILLMLNDGGSEDLLMILVLLMLL